MLRKAVYMYDDLILFDYFNKVLKAIPHRFTVDFDAWRTSFHHEADDGKPRFAELVTYLYYEKAVMKGFIQYGLTNYIINNDFDKCDYDHCYAVIQHIHYDEDSKHPEQLMDMAMAYFKEKNMQVINVFRACFGMSCDGGGGLHSESSFYIEDLLSRYGFINDEESTGYSIDLSTVEVREDPEVTCVVEEGSIPLSPFRHFNGLSIGFQYNGNEVGTCTVRFLNESICYLQYLVMDEKHRCLGLGSRCMNNVFHILKARGIRRMNTSTYTAMGFYEKLGLTSTGLERSYINHTADWRTSYYPLPDTK